MSIRTRVHAAVFSLFVTTLVTTTAVLGVSDPAFAVTPGSVKAHINNVPGNAAFTVSATASGWSRGTIDVSVSLSVGPTKNGPWEHLTTIDNTCVQSTSCSTASGDFGPISGVCPEGACYKAVGRANGPGGAAENNPSTVIKFVHGTLPALELRPAVIAAASVPQDCEVVFVGV